MRKIFIFLLAVVIVLPVSAQLPSYVPTTNLQGWWSFNGNANDLSGNNFVGIVNGAVLTTDRHGNQNSAYLFDGINDWIDFGNQDSLNPHHSDLTVSAWVKTTSAYSRLFSKGSHGGTQPGYCIMIYPGAGGKAALVFSPGGHEHNLTRSNNPINDNQWHMVTGVINRNGNLELYIDGQLQTLTTNISHDAGADVASGTYNATAGASYNNYGVIGSITEFFSGTLDEIGVWRRALTQCEITQLYLETYFGSTISETACDSYTAPDGAVYLTSGIKTAVIPNYLGCDSTITINLTIKNSTSSAISETACDSYTAPDGAVYQTSGINTAVIPNFVGCDSIITINLTIKNSTSSAISETACDSYTAPDGAVYLTSGINTAVIPNFVGCDSTITINLTIKNSTSSAISETACDSYTAPDGQVYLTSGILTAVIPNFVGCDSTITIELNINNSTSSSISETVCDSYTAPDGAVYLTSGIKIAVIPNFVGCDSTITINLTIKNSTSSSISETACDSYTAPDGAIYTTSGILTAVIPNFVGCDSTITINLTINTVDITVNLNNLTITANAIGAVYQWLDCDNNFATISGETGQSFTATSNGNYAVQLTENGCIDTSACVTINSVVVIENSFSDKFVVYPNPFTSVTTLQADMNLKDATLTVYNTSGQQEKEIKNIFGKSITLYRDNLQSGLYFICLTQDSKVIMGSKLVITD